MARAKSSPKKNSKTATGKMGLNMPTWFVGVVFLALPLIYSTGILDPSLTPRLLWLGLGTVLLVFMLPIHLEKNRWPLGVVLYSAFFLTTFPGHFSAINPVESTAAIARIGLWLAMLIAFYKLFYSQKATLKQIAPFVVGAAAIVSLAALPDVVKALTQKNVDVYSVKVFFGHKNFLSSALMLTLPFTVLTVWSYRGPMRLGAIVVLGLVVFEIFVLRTRGVWLGTLIGVVAALVFMYVRGGERRGKTLTVPLTILIGGVAVALFALNTAGVKEKILDPNNISKRQVMWERAWEMFKEQPLTGVGGGNFKIHYPKYGIDPADYRQTEGEVVILRPHNDGLWVLSEFGIVAFVLYASFFVWLIAAVFLTNDKEKKPEMSMALMLVVSYLVYSMGEFPFERPMHSALLMLMAGWLAANYGGKPIKALPDMVMGRYVPAGLAVIALVVFYNRYDAEKTAKEMHAHNTARRAQPMVRAAQDAQNYFYNMDNFVNPLAYFEGMGLTAQQQFEPAESAFKRALDIHPYHVTTLNQMGNLYLYRNDFEKAEFWYREALKVAPGHRMATFNLAHLEARKGNYEEVLRIVMFTPVNNPQNYQRYPELIYQSLLWLKNEATPNKPYEKVLYKLVKDLPDENRDAHINAFLNFKAPMEKPR